MTEKHLFEQLMQGESLSQIQAHSLMEKLTNGAYNHAQMAALLSFFMMRGIHVEELHGFRDCLLEHCIQLDFSDFQAIDLCGTGGDGKNTFNISTLTAFVLAALGQKVSKHGNYGISSNCGSSTVLEKLGYQFTTNSDQLKRELEKANICFLHAPLFHPAIKNVASIRKELGLKTIFNMLGPLVNPARPAKQITGVYSAELARIYGYLLQKTNTDFLVLHSLDGYDECSLTDACKTFGKSGEKNIYPHDFGYEAVNAAEISGGQNTDESVKIFVKILQGKGTPAQNQVVSANAALALVLCGQYHSYSEAANAAQEVILSGLPWQNLSQLMKINQGQTI